ncbi:MAG: hypothetical protein F9K40_20330 [Kofleriaceae bacterium]|nr:MAG: hypothetical protein F9K40_20330 [Kofleriaceae bacterium]MBZ0235342.1 hypothetical protein [Kofleriaceae bacterium]
MTWLLLKLGIRLLGFMAVFFVAARKNPKIKIEPRWAIPLVAGLFGVMNVGMYWLLEPVLDLATFGAAWFAMPLLINLGFLVATLRITEKKKWLVIDGVRATLWLAFLLTLAHGVFWFGLDWIPAKAG